MQEGRLVGYFIGDVGAMNQIVRLWKFEDDADRRRFWEGVFADEAVHAVREEAPAADPDPGERAAARRPLGTAPLSPTARGRRPASTAPIRSTDAPNPCSAPIGRRKSDV